MRRIDLTGQTFGYLKVEEWSPEQRKWKCKCLLCGDYKYVSGSHLTSGFVRSCGKHKSFLYYETHEPSKKEYNYKLLIKEKEINSNKEIENFLEEACEDIKRFSPIQGIYMIRNRINGKVYVGQSKNIRKRWIQEICVANKPKSSRYFSHLSCAFRKYGIDSFDFIVIEECENQDLNDREQYWIEYYDSYNNGYNETPGGDTYYNKKVFENAQNIIDDLLNTTDSTEIIAERWGVTANTVYAIRSGKSWHQSFLSYPLRPFRKRKKFYCISCGAPISYCGPHLTGLCSSCVHTASRLPMPERETLKEKVRVNTITNVAKEYKVCAGTIMNWCKRMGIPYHKREINNYSKEDWDKI